MFNLDALTMRKHYWLHLSVRGPSKPYRGSANTNQSLESTWLIRKIF